MLGYMTIQDTVENFKNDVAAYILRHNLLPDRGNAPVVVALSGGADSVALLDVLCLLGYTCVAAHCNYHLRGAESDRDEAHARVIARERGVSLEVKHFDVEGYRLSHPGLSVEMACRELRYEWFAELLARYNGAAVAVAHHRDDQVETFMLNALRGTGVRGLAAMRPKRDIVIRPLLDISRERVEEYLRCRGVDFVVDSTNLESEFKRNKLRNLVLPVLRSEFPSACSTIAATTGYAAEASDFIGEMVSRIREDSMTDRGLDIRRLVSKYPDRASFILFEIFKDDGMDRSVAESIIKASHGSGQRFGKDLVLDHGFLARPSGAVMGDAVVSRSLTDFPQLCVEHLSIDQFNPKADRSALYLSDVALSGDPIWTLRPWRRGDRISPYGMRGSKLVSDIFSDLHMSVSEKERTLVLLRDDIVIWVAGIRASRHFAVTPLDRSFIKIRLKY